MARKPDIETKPKSTPALAVSTWEMPRRGDSYLQIRIGRNISFAVIFSLLVHLLVLLTFAPKLLSTGEPQPSEEQQPMTVSLGPPSSSKSASAELAPIVPEAISEPQPMARPAVKAVKPRIQPQAKPQPDSSTNKIIALERPAPNSIELPLNPRIPAPVPAPPEREAPTDMLAYVNAARARRQAEQGYTARDSAEIAARDNPLSEDDKRSAIIKRNLEEVGTNGIFQIRELRSNTAQFSFLGWKHEYSNARQELVDVEVGPDGDINRAIAKKMITIIRRDYSGDFNWESRRLGRTIIMSARPEDNAGLEDFLISEFFGVAGIVAR